MSLAQVRKAFVAVIGVAVIIAGQLGVVLGVDVGDQAIAVFDGVVGLLTAFGVFRVPNAPAQVEPPVAPPAF